MIEGIIIEGIICGIVLQTLQNKIKEPLHLSIPKGIG